MGHEQPPTPKQTDNAMVEVVVKANIDSKQTKAMDKRIHWLRDCERQQQFKFYWRPGKQNDADYWTKHHSGAHHVNMRKVFLTWKCSVSQVWQHTLHNEDKKCSEPQSFIV